MVNPTSRRIWVSLASMKLTLVILSVLMVLVTLCTVAQVELGTLGAVNRYMRPFWVWVPLGGVSLPIFPGGALVGLGLLANLTAALVLQGWKGWRWTGLWLAHAGLILLVAGEFVTGAFQVETRMVLEVGQTVDHVEHARQVELALIDRTDPSREQVIGIPERLLAKGAPIRLSPALTLNIRRFEPNAALSMREPADPPALATMGVGTSIKLEPLPRSTNDRDPDSPALLLEPMEGTRSCGVWLVSQVLGQPQAFTAEGRTYSLLLRARRTMLPYSLHLKRFNHDVYPGTNIPKNFSSLVTLSDPQMGQTRDVLISMNQPLRYAGKAFYQSGFDKQDTVSILQVVENPGWLVPYISCVLVTLGLLVHFSISLWRTRKEA